MRVFEERHAYEPSKDPVATIVLTVECNPGEVASLAGFLVGVGSKAGVYSVEMDHTVSVIEKEVTNGEQKVQPEHLDSQAAADEPRSGPASEGQENVGIHGDAAHSVVAGSAGESTTEGPESGNSGGADLRDGGGA